MRKPNPRVVVVHGPEEVAEAALRVVLQAQREALERSGQFHIALAGGSTPRRLYQLLASSGDAEFSNWHVYFGDERWVPADHPDNNARMATQALLDRVAIPRSQVHAIDTTSGAPDRAAQLYSLTLRRRLASQPGAVPRLDLALLGLGADGHTASLFPGSSALTAAAGALVVATWAPAVRGWRVTMTSAVLNAARAVVFLVSGSDKAEALAGVLGDGGTALALDAVPATEPAPASRIRPPDGTLTFVIDEDAAARLGADLRPTPASVVLPALPASPAA